MEASDIMRRRKLTSDLLLSEARAFADLESNYPEPTLYGVTDGKAIGTYFEHKFQAALRLRYTLPPSSSAKGIDFPGLEVDMKVTSVKQPQSSCAFKNARQKIFGLGYSLLVFVYEKKDDNATRTGTLTIKHTIFIERSRAADFQTTKEIRRLLENGANEEELVAFMQDCFLPVDEIEAHKIAKELLRKKPEQGYLTISNALQWRLQYGRAISSSGQVDGVVRVC
jgi:hypothetical protein